MKVTYANAIGDALKEEMRRDGKVLDRKSTRLNSSH